MDKTHLSKNIIEYLSKKLGKSENTIRKDISLLRRNYLGIPLNVVAHIYAMEQGESVMRMLSQEEMEKAPFFIGNYKKPEKKKQRKTKKDNVIKPGKDFSNLRILNNIIRESEKFLWWIDKHFGKRGLDPLFDELNPKIKEVKILLSLNSSNLESLRDSFKRLKKELNEKGVKDIQCRVIVDKKVINSIHGRWIINEKKVYGVPPINSWLQGQHDEIKEGLTKPPFLTWWNQGKDILQNWNELGVVPK